MCGATVVRRLPPFWRWFGIGARAAHLVAVVLLGAVVLGATPRVPLAVMASGLLLSGIALFALDFWKSTDHVRQFAGASMLAKLALVVWMLLDPARAEFVFWLIAIWSVVFAHAPAWFRHRRLGA